MSEFISWFEQLEFWTVLIVFPLLLLIEYLTVQLSLKAKYEKYILLNSWQVIGILFPGFWLLRNVDNYVQAVVTFSIIAFFGVYKPTKYKNTCDRAI